jgi:hypothetical protein
VADLDSMMAAWLGRVHGATAKQQAMSTRAQPITGVPAETNASYWVAVCARVAAGCVNSLRCMHGFAVAHASFCCLPV